MSSNEPATIYVVIEEAEDGLGPEPVAAYRSVRDVEHAIEARQRQYPDRSYAYTAIPLHDTEHGGN